MDVLDVMVGEMGDPPAPFTPPPPSPPPPPSLPLPLPCSWLSTSEDDGAISRTLAPGDPHMTTYQVTTVTGTARSAGSDANISVVIEGADGTTTEPIPLANSTEHKNKFENGNTDIFNVDGLDVGPVVGTHPGILPMGCCEWVPD